MHCVHFILFLQDQFDHASIGASVKKTTWLKAPNQQHTHTQMRLNCSKGLGVQEMKQMHNKISKLGLKNENWGNSKWKKGGWRMKPRQISTKRSQNRANSTYEEKRGLEMKLGANNYQWGVGVICPRFPTPSFRETGGKYLQLKGQSYLPPVGFMKCFPLPGEEGAGQITLAQLVLNPAKKLPMDHRNSNFAC